MTDSLIEQLREALAAIYTVERELGRGGMATVFLAVDRKHRRRVALKLLKENLDEELSTDRFLREIEVTAQLAHPHILPLLDSGEVKGVPFYVMPFVEGESLHDRLAREGRLPLDDAMRTAIEVADALAYAHARGVLHRDIKPGNIMLSGRHALVADFGIAKAMHLATPDDERTQIGIAVGTPRYMSPEQAVADETIDGRSDLYSLATVVYETLVGEPPFSGGGRTTLRRRFVEPVPPVRDRRPEIPEEIEQILLRALAAAPDDRHASVSEFEQALTDATRGSRTNVSTSTARQIEAASDIPSIAVLPFQNLSADPENEYLSDGITEEILTSLSRLRTIRVCARVSSFAFKNTQEDVRAIGERLGVQSVLLGSVRRAGNKLRVTTQLVNTRDGFHQWSERYDRTVDDMFAIQDEISAAIVEALNAALFTGKAIHHITAPTANLDAYDAFLQGRFYWSRRTADSTRQAIEYLRRAIALDPQYAPAHAGLADAWATLAVYGAVAPEEGMLTARRSALAALELDPNLVEARTALGLVLAAHDWDWNRAERVFRDALALNANSATAHQWYAATCLTPQGRFPAALDAMGRALALDPLSPVMRATQASILLYARRYEPAAAAAKSALDLDGGFGVAHFFLSQAYVQLGRFDEAISHAERALELSGSSTEAFAVLGHAAATAGNVGRAREVLAQLEARARERYVSPTHLAQVHLGLGETDRALDRLEAAASARSADLIWLAVRPSYDPLREMPRYRRLLEQLHLSVSFRA